MEMVNEALEFWYERQEKGVVYPPPQIPDGVHLKKTPTHNSVQNPYGLHMDSYGLHLESTWNPSGLQMD
jgi:hypothetical protein